jgi:hypothetical protein
MPEWLEACFHLTCASVCFAWLSWLRLVIECDIESVDTFMISFHQMCMRVDTADRVIESEELSNFRQLVCFCMHWHLQWRMTKACVAPSDGEAHLISRNISGINESVLRFCASIQAMA